MSHYRGVLMGTATVLLAVIEYLVSGIAIVAAFGAVVMLILAGWWGRRLSHALRDLDQRVESLEKIVEADEG